jgi:hypothetical protein
VPLKRRLSVAVLLPDAPTATTRPSGSCAPAAPYAEGAEVGTTTLPMSPKLWSSLPRRS